MIGYIRGTVAQLAADYCFLDVQGIGYRVFIPLSTRRELAVGEVATLFTYLNVREDALLLYGFATDEEYQLFTNLLAVSGIGPKVALGVLSTLSPREFSLAIFEKNIARITKIPGIGKKTAERMILELKDKLGVQHDDDSVAGDVMAESMNTDNQQEALEALMALDYTANYQCPAQDH
jgi:Holliday junction DNA helicase RuvA